MEEVIFTQNGTDVPKETPQQAAKRKTKERTITGLEELLWRSHLVVCGLIVVLLTHAGIEVWQWQTRQETAIFIHQVQVDAHGVAQPVGDPVPAAAYEPQDAQWQAFLLQWLNYIRPRNGEPVSTRRMWQLAARHTCDVAVRDLNRYEHLEQPFNPQNQKKVTIDQIRINKLAPLAFTATWVETTTQNYQQTTETIDATFRMGRMAPDRTYNPAGMCVAWFNWPK